ncbi:cytochrome P450 [Pseudomonas sp. SWRI102]|uniref:Cytochrome P450 n=1 Tax=Pseudomonas marvdashtae TaxID=2745500 RepID=A0A923FK91_9PSED|nr:cytochrome P450 [Pseudomonas marvdashtae]MBV4551366.1 cytochrome P450 [Pseudomonas marvdashtae]
MADSGIPGHRWVDSTWAFLQEGYPFIRKRCAKYRSPVFQTRLLGRRTLCLSGLEAAELFYDARRFVRTPTSTPAPLRNILLGTGSVQGLDGAPHARRKQLFLELLDTQNVQRLARLFEARLSEAIARLPANQPFDCLPWLEALLCRSVCEWAGVAPMNDQAMHRLTRRLASLIDGNGRLDWRMPAAWMRRKACEAQAVGWIEECRREGDSAAQQSPLHKLAQHRDDQGQLLPPHVAAVELLNLLRPVVAVGRFQLFGLIELERRPQWRANIVANEGAAWAFSEEVRRFYAFFPMVAAFVRERFEWRGYRFEKGTRVLLDLFGSNRDPSHWKTPESFAPERFGQCPMKTSVISQGGGEYTYHRCPGEPLTLALMQQTFEYLCRHVHWRLDVKEVDFQRLPMLPREPVLISVVTG